MPQPAESALSPAPAFDEQDRRFARVFDLLRDAITRRAFPGAALAVTHQGRMVALQGFGRFTYDADSTPVVASTIFDLASVTKVVATATMAAILYGRGQLDLDTPVAGILTDFLARDPRRAEVTLRMLLDHSSGLPAYARLFEHAADARALLRAALTLPLDAEPGARAEYSDIGFIVLGAALERLADESLDSFCRREVFGLLGMASTGFKPSARWKPLIPPTADDTSFRHRLIQGEVNDENACVLGGVAGHAGLFAPAADLAAFAHAMLHDGRPILRPGTLDLFTRLSGPPGSSRALGWDTPSHPSQSGRYFSERSFGHLGFTGTSLWIDPERSLSVTLLTNRTWPDAASQVIKEVRPRVHDAIVEALS